MDIRQFQDLMKTLFFERDVERGTMKTFTWFIEEVGELAHELRQLEAGKLESRKAIEQEFGDVLAWLCSLANLAGVDLETAAAAKYPDKCSKCGKNPCECEVS
ncbi:MAG TPA: MazG nucleotide pyrophosphohydrolase domain-containing protein [Candidatus Lokiarchaeia archaeon]|nr:MazG nucleotide pyrophosphohydrolase domain-containing protein [Candidatus Lokiarchaeia archaeon]